jgi:hypothetical protein
VPPFSLYAWSPTRTRVRMPHAKKKNSKEPPLPRQGQSPPPSRLVALCPCFLWCKTLLLFLPSFRAPAKPTLMVRGPVWNHLVGSSFVFVPPNCAGSAFSTGGCAPFCTPHPLVQFVSIHTRTRICHYTHLAPCSSSNKHLCCVWRGGACLCSKVCVCVCASPP